MLKLLNADIAKLNQARGAVPLVLLCIVTSMVLHGNGTRIWDAWELSIFKNLFGDSFVFSKSDELWKRKR